MTDRPKAEKAKGVSIDLSGWGFDPLGISAALSKALDEALAESPPEIWFPFLYSSATSTEPLTVAVHLPLGRYSDDNPEWRVSMADILKYEIEMFIDRRGRITGEAEAARVSAFATALRAQADAIEALVDWTPEG